MSTPAVIRFQDERGKNEGGVYIHWDGYPENMLSDWEKFKEEVREETEDTRFDDAAYLAAKYVVYKARYYGRGLNFLSVGVINPMSDYGQIHTYVVSCDGNAEIKEI